MDDDDPPNVVTSISRHELTAVAQRDLLHWLNQTLQPLSLGLVCFIFLLVGLIMFLLPPVPGVPVYLTAGIIVVASAHRPHHLCVHAHLSLTIVVCNVVAPVHASTNHCARVPLAPPPEPSLHLIAALERRRRRR